MQIAVNRVQPEEMIEAVMRDARALGFRSINIDLIYGLPHQTRSTFAETLERIIDMRPDRLSIFNYAHLPERFMPQRRINSEDLPDAPEKLAIFGTAITRLDQAGYQYIGMDHFALPDDELAIAQQKGKLHRNFQGYTTHGNCDLIGFGVSSISQIILLFPEPDGPGQLGRATQQGAASNDAASFINHRRPDQKDSHYEPALSSDG